MLARAEAAGVAAVVCVASGVADSAAAADLAGRHEQVYCTAGVHPHDAKDAGTDYLRRIEQLAGRAGNVAVGEVGLDYHYDYSPRRVQQQVFAAQLDLARRLARPVVIHTREAFDDALAILSEARLPGEKLLFHSFAGGPAEVGRAIDLGAYVSFSGIVTFKTAGQIRHAAAMLPADRILVETDAPYLSPEPVRKMKINEPANVVHVARCLATVRAMGAEALAGLTTANAVRFFGLDIAG